MCLGENIFKSLRRLGGNKKPVSSADRWKKKKTNIEEPEDEQTKENKINLLKLTGLADSLLQNGDFTIYEKTFEQLSFETKDKSSQFEDADDVRMEDEDDELEAAFKKSSKSEQSNNSDITQELKSDTNTKLTDAVLNEVNWIYKIENTDTSEILGPFSSSQMLLWQEDGRFGNGVYCRKVGTEGSFYNSKRLDFDLYTCS